jgi:hypothetical protein
MRMPIALKSIEDREGLEIDTELDHARRVVTLHMLEFDAAQVTSFLVRALPNEFGVLVGETLAKDMLSLPPYGLVIALAGRNHPALVQHLNSGDFAIRLCDPDAAYLVRCHAAIEELLQALDRRDIEAVVVGVDRHGRPEPVEGFLYLLHDLHDDARQDEVYELCETVGTKHEVSVVETRFLRPCIDLRYAIAKEPHFAWSRLTGRAVLRNWERT